MEYVLLDEHGNPVKVGALLKDKKGMEFTLEGFKPPHKPSSAGFVHVKPVGEPEASPSQREYYATVFNLKFVKQDAEPVKVDDPEVVIPEKAKRYQNAIDISAGAVNPAGISLAIHEACKECIRESTDMRSDQAVKLMVHQLSYIMGMESFGNDLDLYSQALNECNRMAARNR